MMFGRKRSAAKPHFGSATIEREGPRPLTADDMTSFYEAAEQRSSGRVPDIYDLEAMCRELAKIAPVESRSTIRQLKWLMAAQEKYLNGGWDHPWN